MVACVTFMEVYYVLGVVVIVFSRTYIYNCLGRALDIFCLNNLLSH